MNMTFDEAREYIVSLTGLGSKPGLGSISELLSRLGNPQDGCKFVHIAGTNGKGSILNFSLNILKSARYKVGRYTSPVVFSWAEQFGVGAKNITKAEYAELMTDIRKVCDSMVADGLDQPTSFEVETALAFLFFYRKKCDIAVVECGMGGELDATNVIKNTEAACFAQIGLDHTAFLGDTLQAIAETKAGIIKPGCEVVTAPQDEEVELVIKDKAGVNPITIVDREAMGQPRLMKTGGISFDYGDFKDIELQMSGAYQTINASTAIELAQALKRRGYDITDKDIRSGLAMTRWPGRMEVIKDNPLVILDGAHNPHAMAQVKNTLDQFFSDRKLVLIMGMLGDKAISDTVRIIAPVAEQIFTVTPNESKRAMSGIELASQIKPYNDKVTAMDSMKEAVEMAMLVADGIRKQKKKPMILVTGTLSHLANALGCINL